MTKVCTQAGLRRSEKRLLRPPTMLLQSEDPRGEAARSGELDGLRAGAGSLELDRERRVRPDSRAYGEMEDLLRPF